MNFDEFCKQLKYYEECSCWWTRVGGVEIDIQGNAAAPDEKYLKTARMFFENQDKYCEIAVRHLKQMLKFDYKYHFHAVCFQAYCFGMNYLETEEGGFEMMFWQTEPEDDRYVSYVVQFTKDGHYIGLRIFSG